MLSSSLLFNSNSRLHNGRASFRATVNRKPSPKAERRERSCLQGIVARSLFSLNWLISFISLQPRFLSKEERAKIAIAKRAEEIRLEKEKSEAARKDREQLEREAEELAQRDRNRYGGGGSRCWCF